jgi:hypothetical protein
MLKSAFDTLWESIKDSMKPSDRIRMWNEHVRDSWEKEAPAVREDITKQTNDENENVLAEWKKKASFTGSPEDFDQ